MASAVEKACEKLKNTTNDNGNDQSETLYTKKDYDKIVSENKKLKYRIGHLMKTFDELDNA